MTGTKYLRLDFSYERGSSISSNSHEWHTYVITPFGWEKSEIDTNRVRQWSPLTYFSLRDMKTFSQHEYNVYYILTRFREQCDRFQIVIPTSKRFMP